MNCFNCTTPCEYDNGLGYCLKERASDEKAVKEIVDTVHNEITQQVGEMVKEVTSMENIADVVRKNAEPPVSREKFERRKKVWKAHEKAVLEPFLEAAQGLVDAVERYVEPKSGQEFVHRSEILLKKNALKKLL